MLKKITLENFKGFRQLKSLKFKPITVLCGVNSCGKTSILQSILLLKQTLEGLDISPAIVLNSIIGLGSFKNIIFKKDLKKKVSFEFYFKITKEEISVINETSVIKKIITDDCSADYFINYKVSLKNIQIKNPKNSLTSHTIVDQLNYRIESKLHDKFKKICIDIAHEKDNLYHVNWDNGEESNVEIGFVNLIPKDIKFTISNEVYYFLYEINNLIRDILSSYHYIGPLRQEPLRTYVYQDKKYEIGIKGENAAYFYVADKNKSIENHYFYDTHTDCFYKEKSLNLSDALSHWFNLMKIKNFKPQNTNMGIQLTLNSNLSSRTRVNIADVGFGVGQIYPIVIEGLRMPSEHTLLLEQPETHLHPKLQMQIADYFIALALSNKNIIVETHSDHVINRLVRRIVEDKSGRLKDLIGIYFITPTENGATTEEIIIGKYGIENWPDEFFDQVALEQEKIILASSDKRNIIEDRTE